MLSTQNSKANNFIALEIECFAAVRVWVYARRSYEWMQNADKIFLTFFVKSLKPADVKVETTSRSLKVEISNPNAPDETTSPQVYVFHIPELRHEILPEDSLHEIYQVGNITSGNRSRTISAA